MSLLDVRNAKQALAWRLKEWGCDGDPFALAASFIDDLVEKGWRMDATNELRPEIPTAAEACRECNGFAGRCACRIKALVVERDEPDFLPHQPAHADASLARALRDATSRANAIREAVGWPVKTAETTTEPEESA